MLTGRTGTAATTSNCTFYQHASDTKTVLRFFPSIQGTENVQENKQGDVNVSTAEHAVLDAVTLARHAPQCTTVVRAVEPLGLDRYVSSA